MALPAGDALTPMTWTAHLGQLLARATGVGRGPVDWMPRDSDLGAVRAVPLRIESAGNLLPRRGGV